MLAAKTYSIFAYRMVYARPAEGRAYPEQLTFELID